MKTRIILFIDNGSTRWPVLDVVEFDSRRFHSVLHKLMARHSLVRDEVFGLLRKGMAKVRIELEPLAELIR